jgi:DNA-binding IclR family transcriptional regulator
MAEAQNKTRERAGVQVIARAADILRVLESEPDGLSLGQIAQRVDLARSTVQRIVGALQNEHLLVPVSDRGRVRLGPGLARLGNAATTDIVSLVRPVLVDLSQEIGETVDLSVLRNRAAVFVDQVTGSHRLAAVSQIGTVFPLHSTANGKALLACVSAARRRELLSGTQEKDTDRTITDAGKLEKEILRIQETGISYDREEHTTGICAVGTAFVDAFDRPHALSIPVPKTRYDEICATLGEPLLAARDRIIENIGGSLPSGGT